MEHSLQSRRILFLLGILSTLPAGAALSGCSFDPVASVQASDGGMDVDGGSHQVVCGDGIVDLSEACDDGNNHDGDGCDAFCRVEAGWVCTGQPSVCSSTCGDGIMDPGEECDETDLGGATCGSLGYQGGDLGCYPDCTFDTSGCGSQACGNGVVDQGEQCDSRGVDTDECDADCTLPQCGDNHVNEAAGEACDRAGVDTAECDADCTLPECGDGHTNVLAGEVCDDGNTLDGDGCSADCSSNETCGNTILDPNEDCDSGGIDTAECDADCTIPECGDDHINQATGEECDSGGADAADCDEDCTLPVCGDGHVNVLSGEQCEGSDLNGNTCESVGFDGGTLACTRGCMFDTTQCYRRICGDGIVVPGEECDDGNTDAGDGCSDSCTVEPYFVCEGSEPSVCSCRVYVDAGPVSGSNRDGQHWNSAYSDIQPGIDQAAQLIADHGLDRCDVWVAEGDYLVYKDSSSNMISLASHVAVFGGFDRTEASPDERDLSNNQTHVSGCDTEILPCTNNVKRVFTADQVTDATMDGLVISDGSGGSSGGGLFVTASSVFVQSCRFADNQANNGGAVHVTSDGLLFVADTEFVGNQAGNGSGGALWAESGQVEIQSVVFDANWADSNGGALWIESATVETSDATFVDNGSSDSGGAVEVQSNGTLNLTNVVFATNTTSTWHGGALDCNGGSVTATGCLFDQNLSGDTAGALAARNGCNVSLVACVFSANTTKQDQWSYSGGAIGMWGTDTNVEATRCRFIHNEAPTGRGGAIYLDSSAQLAVARSWFEDNTAEYGGGAICSNSNNTDFSVTDSVLWKNRVTGSSSGGAIHLRGSSTGTIVNCTFLANVVEGNNNRAGGVFARDYGTVATIINSILWGDIGPETVRWNSGVIEASYSDIQNQADNTNHVISQAPLFVDANNGNFELQSNSPCIDAANGDEASNADLLERIRWDDPNVPDTGTGSPTYVDMGAMEYRP